ncbi:MAG: leucine-rich repeat protein [Bacilli bacterium]
MAKMVQDLSQDFIYEDEVQNDQKHKKLTPKQRNYVIGLSILGVAIILISVIYALAANVWLADYKTIGYLTFAYPTQTEEEKANGVVTEAQVISIDLNSNYPSTFRIPSEIKGHPITSIADGAFQGADRLKKIIMTNNITYVGDNAFAGCTELKTIQWSKNLSHIGTNAFINTAYEASWDENGFEIVNNILLNVGSNYFPSNTVLVNNENSIIPEEYQTSTYQVRYFDDFSQGVDTWMNGLFQDNSHIVYLETPSYLDYIPFDAFYGCSNLKEVKLGEHVTSLYSGSFKDCTSLTKINLENVTIIESEALKNTNINFSLDLTNVKQIGDSAFEGCSSLTEVTYSSTVTKVPNSLFKNCSSLQSITFPNFDNMESLGVSSFENTALRSFTVPKRINSLNDRLFANCSQLETVSLYNNTTNTYYEISEESDEEEGGVSVTKIYEGVNRINAYVFYNCSSFTSLKLYDVNGDLIPGSSNDGEINLPVTVTSTSNANGNDLGYAFAKTSASKAKINKELITLGDSFFEDNTSISEVVFEQGEIVKDDNDKVIDPGYKITSIGEKAFKGTTNLVSISIPSTVTSLGTNCFAYSGVETVTFNDPIGDYKSLSSLQNGTFSNCPNLTTVNLPTGISMIAKGTFSNCPSLTSLYIPEGIKTLNQGSFTNCGNETTKLSIYIHKTLTEYLSSSNYFYVNSKKEPLWCDDSCEVYLYSEEQPTATSPACKGFFHFDENGEIAIWPAPTED